MSGPLGNHIMPSHEFYQQQQQQQTQRPPVRRPDKSHNQEIMRKNDHALAPNLPGRSPGGDARMKGTVFANAARGLTGDNIRKLTSYWQRTITETEENEHDFKSHALPLARIKKVMKADEDVKMISAEAPILFAKACEIFINELTRRAWIHAEENKRRTLQRSDIANAISRSDMFDFLIDIVPRDEFVAQGVAEAGPDAQPVVGAAGGFMGMPLGHAVQPHPGAHIVQQDHQRHSPNEGYYPQHKQEGAPMNGHYQPTQQSMHQHPQHRQPLLAQHHAMQQDPSQQQQQQQQQPAHHLLPQHTMYEQQRYSMPHSAMPPMGNSHPAYLDHMGYHPGYGQHNPMNQPYGNPYSHPYVTQQHPPPPHQHREGEVDVSNAHYGHR